MRSGDEPGIRSSDAISTSHMSTVVQRDAVTASHGEGRREGGRGSEVVVVERLMAEVVRARWYWEVSDGTGEETRGDVMMLGRGGGGDYSDGGVDACCL